jgi:hypothetical protein
MTAVAQFDERLRDARRELDARQSTGQALADALKLQHSTQQRILAPSSKRGRRRKGHVIDLDQRTFIKPKRRKWLLALLVAEAAVAVIAVMILVAYIIAHGGNLQ